MTQAQYRVVFHGEVDTDHDVEEVKHNIGVLFKTSGDQVDRLFAKPTVVIKNRVDYRVAMGYKSALQKAGAVCHVESLGDPEPLDASSDVQQSAARQEPSYASVAPPFLPLISSAFSYPLQGRGAYIVAGGVLFSLLTSLFGLLFGILTGGYIGAYLMKVISDSADGEDELPEWLDLEFWADEIIRPYACMVGIVVACYFPALLYTHHVSFIMSPNYAWLGFLLVLGSLYAPMGLATASVLKTLNALHPLLTIQSIAKIPRDYAIVWGTFLVAVSVSCVNIGGWPGAVLGKLLGFYLLMVSMRLLGLLCRSHEARLDWFEY